MIISEHEYLHAINCSSTTTNRKEGKAKYITNDLVDVGNCDKQISFLDNNKNTESTVNFYNTNHSILMVQAHELVNLPPKERAHWEEYKLPLTFEPIEVE